MNWRWRNRLGLGGMLLVVLAGCANLSGRDGAAGDDAARTEATVPTIPVPVPVEVAPEPAAPSALTEAELAAAVAVQPEVPEAPPPGDLLERIRGGLVLGQHFNSRIDREADWFARNPEYVQRVFTRAAPYLHYIVGEVEARGLPLEIALLPIIESAFQPYAYSRARADGLWQFIPTTGGRFGLKQDWWYDGRRDVVAATQAALDYLTYLNNMFKGDWLHAIAAYNCGEGTVSRAIRRNAGAKKRTDFWNLTLPAETRGYVPRLLAMARVVAKPDEYGLSIDGMPDIPYFDKVETGGQISLEVAAELAGITTEQMYALNPAHHRWATDPTGPHMLLVPVESAKAFQENLLLLTPDQRMRVERYTVRDGDTITSIAQRFKTTAQHLRELNELGNASAIAVGAELRVPSSVASLPPQVLQAAARVDNRQPATVRAVHVVRQGDTLWTIARRHNVSVNALAQLNRINASDTLRVGQRLRLHDDSAGGSGTVASTGSGRQVTYVVRRGDTLSTIARTLKVTVANLRAWNNISGSAIRPGQRLVAYPSRGS